MSRYSANGNADTPWRMDGDPAFKGVDMFHDRATLAPGYLALSVNKRLRDGAARTRPGTSLPGDFNPAFEDTIVGALVYNNPNGSEVMLVATANADYVWALQFGRDPIQVPLESPETIGNYAVEFVQAFDKVLLLRRPVTLATQLANPTCTFATDATGDITCSAAHHLSADMLVWFFTTDTLPTSVPPGLAVNTQYYVLAAGLTATKLRISATLGGAAITFSTAGSGIHKIGKVPLVPMLQWDGNFDTATHKFEPIELDPPGLNLVPVAWHGEPFANRVIYYAALHPNLPWRDQLVVSDLLNYTSYDDVLGIFRINAGESNTITRVMGYFRGAVVIFMRQGIHMLSFGAPQADPVNDFYLGAQQRMLSSLGSVGNKMPLQDGADIIFLSHPEGFYRLGEVIQDQIAVQPIPISRAIQPVIEQIDWNRAYTYACSAGLGDYDYFGLPLLGYGGANNVIVVYNRTRREWESTDVFVEHDFRVKSLHTTLYAGARQLFMIGDIGSESHIYLCNSGATDEIGGVSLPVVDVMETRGYTLGDPAAFKRFERLAIGLSTYDPDVQITAIGDGHNELKELATVTKDRERSYVHGRGKFDPDTDDPDEQRREDYSTIPALDFAGEDFEAYSDGPVRFLRATPISFTGIKQQALERFQIRQNGRWVSLRVYNTNGQCDVLSVAVEGRNTQETMKVIA